MNYGCGEPAETNTSMQYGDDYWSNPPSDINSEEYRVWYERYCSYFYPQAATEANATSTSVDSNNGVRSDALSASIDSSVANLATVMAPTTTDAERPSDAVADTTADNAAGKKRKKNKKTDLANPKPTEPPGKLVLVMLLTFILGLITI